MSKVFVIDPSVCNGCHCCQIVCKDEHCGADWLPYAKSQPDTGQFWRRVDEKVRGTIPKVKISYLSHGCMHCDDCPLIDIAPDAVYKREDGLVIIDPEKAKGMRQLVEACPYDAVFWNEEHDIPQKCTGCAHLLDDGWDVPRCVDSCPHDAIRFGDEEDFRDEIAAGEVLKPEAGTNPRTYYLNLPKRFIAGCVIDSEADEVLIGATVTVQNVATGEVIAVQTDDFGDFWFKEINPGEYNIFYQMDGYLLRTDRVDAISEDKNVGYVSLYLNESL